MAFLRKPCIIKYRPDPAKTIEDNLKTVFGSIAGCVDDNDFEITLEMTNVEEFDAEEIENLINDSMELAEQVEKLDLKTPHSVTPDGKPLFTEKG